MKNVFHWPKLFGLISIFSLVGAACAQSDYVSSMPLLDGGNANLRSVSFDGSSVAASSPSGLPAEYGLAQGWQMLPFSSMYGNLSGLQGAATSVSDDGSVAAGYTEASGDANQAYAYWSQGGEENVIPLPAGMTAPWLNALSSGSPVGAVVSGDGSNILLTYYVTGLLNSQITHAFIYNVASGNFTDLGAGTVAVGLSRNGSTVVGAVKDILTGKYDGFTWTTGNGMQSLGLPLGYLSVGGVFPSCMSQDASVIYGTFSDIFSNEHTFKWTLASGVAEITSFVPTSASSDGTMVVGLSPDGSTDEFYNSSGLQTLSAYLANQGANMSNWTLNGSPLISGDGKTLYTSGSSGSSVTNLRIGPGDNISAVSFAPNNVMGGSSSTGTVALAYPAPAGGWTVQLSSHIPSYVGVPSSVTIPEGASSATFAITTKAFRQSYTDLITATDAMSTMSVNLNVTDDSIFSVGMSPSTLMGGTSSMGTVTLLQPAPANGWVVNLASQLPSYVGVPSSIMVPAGATTATFTATTKIFRQTYANIVTANDATSTNKAVLTVLGESVSSMSLSPSSVMGGGSSTGTINLLQPAPAGGWTVNLLSQIPSYVSVPASVTIPAGSSSTTFPITASPFRQTYLNIVTATDATSVTRSTLTVIDDSLSGLSLSPDSVMGGQSSTGTINLLQPAPSGGWTVNLVSQLPGYVGVPASVTVPAGSTSATFPITSKIFRQTYTNLITATDGASSRKVILTVMGESIASITLNPSSVVGGGTSTGTITLLQPAPVGGWTVNLTSQIPSYVGVTPSVTIPAGSTTATFSITTNPFRQTYTDTITGTDATSNSKSVLTVTTS